MYFTNSTWDETTPGTFYEQIKHDFPAKQQREMHQDEVLLGYNTASAEVRKLSPRMQFISKKGDRMIQLAENLLVINHLHPYPGFKTWEPILFRALEAYRIVAMPQRVRRMGLRYINRIEIPGTQVVMENYFRVYPQLPTLIGNTHGAFLVRVEVPQSSQGHSVIITFSTGVQPQSNEDGSVFMLDLYDIGELDVSPEPIALEKEIRRAHDNVVMAFEGSITDELRDLLGVRVDR